MQMSENIFHKLISNTINENEINTVRFKNLNNNYSKVCLSILLQTFTNHPDANLASQFLKNNKNHSFNKFLTKFKNKNKNDFKRLSNKENLWSIFSPTAIAGSSDPKNFKNQILEKRILKNLRKPKHSIQFPHKEILFLSNILITIPEDYKSNNIPLNLQSRIKPFLSKNQNYWYDHPIPIDAFDHENEILYGLRHLDKALNIEFKRGNLKINEKISLILSLSVTHIGLEEIAFDYVKNKIGEKLNLKFINVFIFDENRTSKIINTLFPKHNDYQELFGVNGNYGRHYTFLKYALILWNKVINKSFKYSFKIDLDQVFDQNFLIRMSKMSIFEIFKNQKYWGGSGIDFEERLVDLGMLAGGLVNKGETHKDYLIPDVKRPLKKTIFSTVSSKRVFCPDWSHALSTEAEIIYENENIHRVHVTGGTTGITLNALEKWAPFTPSFINRAEDQAFIISSLNKNEFLSHIHAPYLIMRHDKLDFAKRTVTNAKLGKEIGNLERILLFSYYSKCPDFDFNLIKGHLWPYTSSFIQKFPEILLYFILLIDGISKSEKFLHDASIRLKRTQNFCNVKLEDQFKLEKEFWKNFILRTNNILDVKSSLREIIYSSQIVK